MAVKPFLRAATFRSFSLPLPFSVKNWQRVSMAYCSSNRLKYLMTAPAATTFCPFSLSTSLARPRKSMKKTFDFSDGYFSDGTIFVVAADSKIDDYSDLKGKTIAAKRGTVSTDYAESLKDKYKFNIQYFEDSPAMYQAVLTGTAVACFEDFSVIGWAIKNEGVALKTVGEVVNPNQYGFATKKGENSERIEKFNAGLKNIKENGKYDEILAKYGY